MPFYPYDKELTALCWYWSDQGIIVMMDAHTAIEKEVLLPEYMNGMKLQILDKTESFHMTQEKITDRRVQIKTDGYGYLVIRLY